MPVTTPQQNKSQQSQKPKQSREPNQREKVILITGASSGIGLASAILLAERGYTVYATMRDLDRQECLANEAAAREVSLSILQLDITDEQSIKRVIDTIICRFGKIDGIVNCAGIQLRGYFEDLSQPEIEQLFETNLFGAMALTRAILPHMRMAKAGRILLISSIGGLIGSMSLTAYCATKFALEGFGEAIALETAPLGIQVSLIEPAILRTEIWGRNRGIAQGALKPDSTYKEWFHKSEQLTDRLVQSATIDVTDVAKVIDEALSARHPKLRYVVGNKAKIILLLRKLLPSRLFESLYFGTSIRLTTNP